MTSKEREKLDKLLQGSFKLSLFTLSSRRRKHKRFSFLVLLIVASMSLYLATYFHAVASRWTTGKSIYWLSQQQIQHRSHQQKQQILQLQTNFENGSGIILEQNLISPAIGETGEDEMRSLEEMSCILPKLNPFDESIIEFIKAPQIIDCDSDGSYPNFFHTDFKNTLIQTETFLSLLKGNVQEIECCYQTFHRETPLGLFDKGNIRVSLECFRIDSPRQKIPKEHEFIYVQCKNGTERNQGNHTNEEEDRKQKDNATKTRSEKENERIFFRDMFAFVPIKSRVEQRITQYEKYREISNQYRNHNNNKNNYTIENRRKKTRRKLKESNSFTAQENNKHENDESDYSDDDDNYLNVLLLGLDAQSHMNFLRQMPLTVDYLVNNLSAIGLSGLTKLGDNTFPNLVPLLTGLNTKELTDYCWNVDNPYFDDCPFIWKQYSKQGYRTSFAEDSIWMSIFTYNKPGFSSPPTDYYLHPFMDLMAKRVGHEVWGNSELCYGNRLGFQILLDYIIKTAVTFQGQRKDNKNNNDISDNVKNNVRKKYFQFVFVSSLFHDFLNLPKLGDELLLNTIKYLHRHNYLNNTLLLVHSDHGIRFGPIRKTIQGKIEENMPLAYFVLPPWFHEKYPHLVRNLRTNSQRLTTPFDIHQTLLDVLKLKSLSNKNKGFETALEKVSVHHEPKSEPTPKPTSKPRLKRSISLFDIIPKSRTCEDAQIEEHYCVCNYENLVQISNETQLAKMAAEFVVQKINELLFDLQEEEYCAKLQLSKILRALKLTRAQESFTPDMFSYARSFSSNSNSNSSNDRKKSDKEIISNQIKNNSNTSSILDQEDEINKGNSDSDSNSDEAIRSTEMLQSSSILQLQITLLTEPGDGKFEATIVAKNVERQRTDELPNFAFSISGEISRINLYGLQSSCIANSQLQKYCYCIESDR